MSAANPENDTVERYRALAGTGPVVMVNLIKFKGPDEQRCCIEGLREIVGPMLADLGAETIYAGSAGPEVNMGDDWDVVVLVRYPDFEAFASLVASPEWVEKAGALREETIADSRLVVMHPPS